MRSRFDIFIVSLHFGPVFLWDEDKVPLPLSPDRFTSHSDAENFLAWLKSKDIRIEFLNEDGLEDVAVAWNHGGREEWSKQ